MRSISITNLFPHSFGSSIHSSLPNPLILSRSVTTAARAASDLQKTLSYIGGRRTIFIWGEEGQYEYLALDDMEFTHIHTLYIIVSSTKDYNTIALSNFVWSITYLLYQSNSCIIWRPPYYPHTLSYYGHTRHIQRIWEQCNDSI